MGHLRMLVVAIRDGLVAEPSDDQSGVLHSDAEAWCC